MAPESQGAVLLTATILGCKLLQALHMALVLPYRGVWACRMGFLIVCLQAACAGLLLMSQLDAQQAASNAVSMG